MPRHDDATGFHRRLTVSPEGDDRFSGTCHPGWPGRAFGGQVVAKALHAAACTVDDDQMQPLSIHAWFHAPVASGEHAHFDVSRVKDGRTLATRQVQVIQDDRLRVTAMALMGRPGAGPEHQWGAPAVPAPDAVTPEERLVPPSVAPVDADFAALGYPDDACVDLRFTRAEPDATGHVPAWMRVTAQVSDDAVTAASALCYLADITLGTIALGPHGGREATTHLQLGALELALWFMKPIPPGEWVLFQLGTAASGGGHGLAHAVAYDQSGEVVLMAMQNALMREP